MLAKIAEGCIILHGFFCAILRGFLFASFALKPHCRTCAVFYGMENPERLIIRKISEVGGDTKSEPIGDIFAILEGGSTFKPEYAKDTINGITYFRIIL